MTRKHPKRTALITTSIFLMVLFIAFCVVFAPSWDGNPKYPGSTGDFRQHGNYEIISDSILTDLDSGNTNVFMSELATLDVDNPSSTTLWQPADYLKVVNALHQHVWHESLTDWKVYEILLNTSCEGSNKGFATGRFTFFKTVWLRGSLYYTGRSMTLLPQYDTVSWGGETNFPRPILGWKEYDLSGFKILGEDAIRIAEKNGGEEIRLRYDNRCELQLSLGDMGWKVSYIKQLPAFTINIDPYTGEFSIQDIVQ